MKQSKISAIQGMNFSKIENIDAIKVTQSHPIIGIKN